jgi:hypothetical protein
MLKRKTKIKTGTTGQERCHTHERKTMGENEEKEKLWENGWGDLYDLRFTWR